jgi:muconate cycloisomerase
VRWNAARCAVELALLDCVFRTHGVSINSVLPARRHRVIYSGVISAGSIDLIERIARRCKEARLKYIKMKVCGPGDAASVGIVRDILGPVVSIRLDANGAFEPDAAADFLSSVSKHDIACVEQPIPRGDPADLASVRAASPIPIMADESVVTVADAQRLIKHEAVDYLNLRLSKCGGIHRTLVMADPAKAADVGVQLGCQVGETAVLSAAGRHVAAHLEGLRFVEGSYGAHLLAEDIAEEDMTFGLGGNAPILAGSGLGISVREDLLLKYAWESMSVP